MLHVLALVIAFLAFFAWASAAVHAVLLLAHRRDDQSLVALALGGHRFFSQDTWKPSGHALHGRFLKSALAFFGLVLLAIVLGGIAATTAQ